VAVAVATFVATVAMPVVTFVAVIAFTVIVAVIAFTVIVAMLTFVAVIRRFLFVTGRFLFMTGRFFLRMATTPTVAHPVFAVVVLVEARAFSASECEVAAAGERDRTAGTDAENRSRKDSRHT
jgi:hypothetical protein